MPKLNVSDQQKISSKFIGVYRNTTGSAWVAQIKFGGASRHLGSFEDDRVAAVIHNIAKYFVQKNKSSRSDTALIADKQFGAIITEDQSKRLFLGSIGPIPVDIINYVNKVLYSNETPRPKLKPEQIEDLSNLFPENLTKTNVTEKQIIDQKEMSGSNRKNNVSSQGAAYVNSNEEALQLTQEELDWLSKMFDDDKDQTIGIIDLLAKMDEALPISPEDAAKLAMLFSPQNSSNQNYSIRITELGNGYKVGSLTLNGKYYPIGACYDQTNDQIENFALQFIQYLQQQKSNGLQMTNIAKSVEDSLIERFEHIQAMEKDKPDLWARVIDQLHYLEHPETNQKQKQDFAKLLADSLQASQEPNVPPSKRHKF